MNNETFRKEIAKQCGFFEIVAKQAAEAAEDLRYESLMDDQQERGPIDNQPDDVGWRQV